MAAKAFGEAGADLLVSFGGRGACIDEASVRHLLLCSRGGSGGGVSKDTLAAGSARTETLDSWLRNGKGCLCTVSFVLCCFV